MENFFQDRSASCFRGDFICRSAGVSGILESDRTAHGVFGGSDTVASFAVLAGNRAGTGGVLLCGGGDHADTGGICIPGGTGVPRAGDNGVGSEGVGVIRSGDYGGCEKVGVIRNGDYGGC